MGAEGSLRHEYTLSFFIIIIYYTNAVVDTNPHDDLESLAYTLEGEPPLANMSQIQNHQGTKYGKTGIDKLPDKYFPPGFGQLINYGCELNFMEAIITTI
jgi:hypothetical protein